MSEPDIGEFLVARGGPFFELQRQLGLLHDRALRAGSRALMFVAIAWGIPVVLSLIEGTAFGPYSARPFLLDASVAARFLIAVGLFILMERYLEERLRTHLKQFVRAPMLAPESLEDGAAAVTRALKRRDGNLAELVCLLIAIAASGGTAFSILGADSSYWAVTVSEQGAALTVTAWWCLIVSSTLFWFLMLRCFWRHFVWALLLRDIAGLELRLVVTHPDGLGGLRFLGKYPNAYSVFVFALSCVLAASVGRGLVNGNLSTEAYGYIMATWLVIVIVLFAFPLQAFSRPLTKLKEQTLLVCSAQATRHCRADERKTLGRNIAAAVDAEPVAASDIPDPSKLYAAANKLSTILVSRSALVPIGVAALVPMVAAGATKLPFMDLFKIAKRLLLL